MLDSVGIGCTMEQQADIDQALRIPYLPLEVHHIIARYVHWADLPNYRLASRLFADVGAHELFGAIPFHCSSASAARIDAIKASKHLNKYVSTLTWDANYWNIPDVRDLHEWQLHFMMKSECAELEPPMPVGKKLSIGGFVDLAFNRREWELYLDRTHDEKVVKKDQYLLKLFAGFRNLYKMNIFNGTLARTQRGVQKCSDYIDAEQPDPPAAHYRGESLYNCGNRVGPLQRPGGHAFAVLRSLPNIDWHLTKLRLDAICWSTFSDPIGQVSSLQHLTSLHLWITLRFEDHEGNMHYDCVERTLRKHVRCAKKTFSRHHLMQFLVNLSKLRSLKLGIAERLGKDPVKAGSPLTISDVFGEHHTWPDLEKLALVCFDTTPKALLSLMDRQRSTLKALELDQMRITHDDEDILPMMAPPEILTRLNETLSLERAKLTGYFGYTSPIIWYFNREKGHHPSTAEEYLVNGGVCPLNESNSIVI
jgi:hypothetical protein